MAITQETLAAPTLLAIGDSATAGTLVPGQTWYFRVVALKGTHEATQYMESAWMIEASHTVGAGKSAIDISWGAVAGADRYYVLGTQTSGVYTDTGHVVIGFNLSATSFTWTGTWPTWNYRYFWYRPSGVPNILVEGGSAGTPLTFDDLVDADVAGGWNRVDRQRVKGFGIEPYIEYNAGTPRAYLKNSYIVDATLSFGQAADCYFRQYNADIVVVGTLRFSNTYTKLFQLGYREGTKLGQQGCELRVRGCCSITWDGVVRLYATSMIAESAPDSTWSRCPYAWRYAHTWRLISMSTATTCDFNASNCLFYGPWDGLFRAESGETKNCTYLGLQAAWTGTNVTWTDDKAIQCRFGVRVFYHIGSKTWRRCEVLYGCGVDISWDQPYGNIQYLIDCTFNSQNQGNNDPFGWWGRYATVGPDAALHFLHQFDPIFVDTEGNPLAGATILLKDTDLGVIINDTTNASGKLSGGSRDVTRQVINCDPSNTSTQTGKYLSWMIAQGYLLENVRNPHTLIVSKDGKTYFEASFDIEARMTSYIVVDITELVYPTISDISITDGDKDALQIGQTYTVQVTVDSAGADKTYQVRCYATCPRGLGVVGFPSSWIELAPDSSHVFEGTITPAEAGGIDNLAFRLYCLEE